MISVPIVPSRADPNRAVVAVIRSINEGMMVTGEEIEDRRRWRSGGGSLDSGGTKGPV